MEARELRIGNWVYKEVGITALEPFQLEINDIVTHYHTERLKPIPLTEEWFVKFGFKRKRDGDYWKSAITLTYIYGEGWDAVISDLGVSIKYVHQLQNLYFALTGKELQCQK